MHLITTTMGYQIWYLKYQLWNCADCAAVNVRRQLEEGVEVGVEVGVV